MIRKLFLVCCCVSMITQMTWRENAAEAAETTSRQLLSPLTPSRCIEIALEQNHKHRISRLAVETAEYQHKQALSSFWPQVTFDAAYIQQDEDINFIFPSNTYNYSITLPGPMTISGQTTVPEQDITVMDRQSVLSSLNVTYPLFTGGLRSNTVKAAESNVKAAVHALRRTELELVRDVQRMYYGAVLAQRLADIGEKTLIRLETTTDLTERLYKGGSGSVTKLDYLRSRVMLESARSINEGLKSNVALSKAALVNTMGLQWNTPLTLAETSIPFAEINADVDKLVADAYRFNPDWKRLAAGLDAAQALVNKERSAHWPKVALNGTLWRWSNDLDGEGLATDENVEGWSVGVGFQMPLFTGFLTTNKILESKARLKKMESRRILLKEGLALQVKHGVIRMGRSQKIREASLKAAGHAKAHRELAVRAYMNELISTKEVIESQIVEALACARSETAQYENAVARFDIDFIVGQEVQKLLEEAD
ncbi:MAG: TolC family protein [Desulfobacteraceae bacterium]